MHGVLIVKHDSSSQALEAIDKKEDEGRVDFQPEERYELEIIIFVFVLEGASFHNCHKQRGFTNNFCSFVAVIRSSTWCQSAETEWICGYWCWWQSP